MNQIPLIPVFLVGHKVPILLWIQTCLVEAMTQPILDIDGKLRLSTSLAKVINYC